MFSIIRIGAMKLLKKAAIQVVLAAAVEGGIHVFNQVTSNDYTSTGGGGGGKAQFNQLTCNDYTSTGGGGKEQQHQHQQQEQQQQLPPPPKVDSGRVKFLRSSSEWIAYYEASKSSDKLIVLSIISKWSEPCRTIEPTVNELAAKYRDVEFVKIDVNDLLGEANNGQYQVGVNVTVPTFLFLKKGTEVDKVLGAKRDELRLKLENCRSMTKKSPRPSPTTQEHSPYPTRYPRRPTRQQHSSPYPYKTTRLDGGGGLDRYDPDNHFEELYN